MKVRTLATAMGLLLQVPVYAAVCSSAIQDFGILQDQQIVSFSGSCAGGGDYGDPARVFHESFSFTLDETADRLFGQLALHPIRDFDPSSSTRGQFLYGLSISSITLSRDGGPAQFIGTGFGTASAEWADFFADSIGPGHYTLTLNGSTFGLNAQGSFDAMMGVILQSAVPEPDSVAMMLAGLAAIGATLKRRRS